MHTWKSLTPHYIRLHCIKVQFSMIHRLTRDVYKSRFNFQTGFKVRVHHEDLCSKFLSQKVLHKQDMKSFASRGLQSGLVSCLSPRLLLLRRLGRLALFRFFCGDTKREREIRQSKHVIHMIFLDHASIWFTAENRFHWLLFLPLFF